MSLFAGIIKRANNPAPAIRCRDFSNVPATALEWMAMNGGNAVKGNTQLPEPGKCFSNEPTISIIGEFGLRFKDCVYITDGGLGWFSQLQVSNHDIFS